MFNKNRRFLILSIVFTVLSLALNAFIIYQACLKGGESSSWSETISVATAEVINTISPNTITEANMPDWSSFIRKAIGHFGLFGIDSIVTTLAVYFSIGYSSFYKHSLGISLTSSIGVLVAIVTELIQKFTAGRSGEVSDVLIDSAGYLLGVAIIYLIIMLIIRNNRKKALARA